MPLPFEQIMPWQADRDSRQHKSENLNSPRLQHELKLIFNVILEIQRKTLGLGPHARPSI